MRYKKLWRAPRPRPTTDGVVVYKVKWNGERYRVGENVWSGMPIIEIPELNTILAEALVPEVDIEGRRRSERRSSNRCVREVRQEAQVMGTD